MTISIPNSHKYNITREVLAQYIPARRPLIAGNSWWVRFRIKDSAGNPVDLTLVSQVALIEFLMIGSLKSGATTFTRRSDANRTGINPAIKQIVVDAQSEDGLGCLTVYFDPGDKTALLTLPPTVYYELRVTYASGEVITEVAGQLEIMRTPGSY